MYLSRKRFQKLFCHICDKARLPRLNQTNWLVNQAAYSQNSKSVLLYINNSRKLDPSDSFYVTKKDKLLWDGLIWKCSPIFLISFTFEELDFLDLFSFLGLKLSCNWVLNNPKNYIIVKTTLNDVINNVMVIATNCFRWLPNMHSNCLELDTTISSH